MPLTIALYTVTLFVCFRQREVKLDLYQDGVLSGHGYYKEEYKGKDRTSTFDLTGTDRRGIKRHVIQVKTIDSRAYPVEEKEIEVEWSGRQSTTTVSKVHYDVTGAAILNVSVDGARDSERSFVPIPGLSTADESDLWFVKIFPSPGTTVTSTVFEIEKPAKWQKIVTTYVRKTWITIGGNSVEAYEVKDVRDGVPRKVYLDKDGMPVLMVQGIYRTEKHFGK